MTLPNFYQEQIDNTQKFLEGNLFDNLFSLVLYGSLVRGDFVNEISDINLLVILNESTPQAHTVLADLVAQSSKINPFVITRRGMARSFSAFTLKFSSIQRNYRLLAGQDPFTDFHVDDKLAQFLSEQALRNLRLRTVRSFIYQKNKPDRYRDFLIHVLPMIIIDISAVMRFEKVEIPSNFSERIPIFAEKMSIDTSVLSELISYKDSPSALTKDDIITYHNKLYHLLDNTIQ